MKRSIRLTALAITAVALAGPLGAQSRANAHAGSRAQALRGHTESRARPAAGTQHYAAAQAETRGRNDFRARDNFRGRSDVAGRNDFRGRNDAANRADFRGRSDMVTRTDFRSRDGRVPVATHGRPLITRASVSARAYGRSPVYAASRFARGRFIPRGGLPFGWEHQIVFHGLFPLAYGGYCDAVPLDYDYLLPPMAPSYDPCLFGNRVIVFDRFSRSIVFVATI